MSSAGSEVPGIPQFSHRSWINQYVKCTDLPNCYKKMPIKVCLFKFEGATVQVSRAHTFIGQFHNKAPVVLPLWGFNRVDLKLTWMCGCGGWCPGRLPERTQSARSATLAACCLNIQSVHTADKHTQTERTEFTADQTLNWYRFVMKTRWTLLPIPYEDSVLIEKQLRHGSGLLHIFRNGFKTYFKVFS